MNAAGRRIVHAIPDSRAACSDSAREEAERADASEIAGEQRFEPFGIPGLLGGGPLVEERADVVSHGDSFLTGSGVAGIRHRRNLGRGPGRPR